MKVLVINAGSTSTKIAVYEDHEERFKKTVDAAGDSPEEMATAVLAQLHEAGYALDDMDAICSRGGTLKPIESGTYLVDEDVLKDVLDPLIGGRHVSTRGILVAHMLAAKTGVEVYFTDPVSTDELIDEARVTGFCGMERKSMFHALNQKTAARKVAALLGRKYEQLNLIGVHMGGGVCVAAHRRGRVIDNYNVQEDGGFSMNRAGNLPTLDLVDYCFSGKSKEEILGIFRKKAGVLSYLGTDDFREVERRVLAGDAEAKRVFRAMVYQYAQNIGAMAASLRFDVDAIFLTGGIANSRMMCDALRARVERLARVIELPGENEMESLAEGAFRVLDGEPPKRYGRG